MDLGIQPRPLSVIPTLIEPGDTSKFEIQPRPIAVATTLGGVEDQRIRLAKSIVDPKIFAKTYLQTDLWDVQAEIFDAIATKPKVAVKACHASSKTFTAAILTLWFLARHKEAVVITTAPTHNQVQKLLWGEIHSALSRSRYPFPKPIQTELHMGPKRFAYGISTLITKEDEGVRFQGVHAENVLVIVDEAPGINVKIWEAIEGARAGGNVKVLAIGNPTIASGPFHTAFTEERSGWKCFTIDAFDTPNFKGLTLEQLVDPSFPDEDLDKNVCPYLVTRRWVKEKYFEYGVDHPFWESRVRGRFPKQSPDALFSLTWLEEGSRREVAEEGECTAGLDVAGPGEDETSLTIRIGKKVVLHKQWTQADPRGYVVAELMPYKAILKAVNVDSIGIGWNMYLHIKDQGFPAVPVNVCETSSDSEKYANQKSEFFWGLRMRYEAGDIGGITDDKTIGQLAGIRYKPTARGQIEIESKEDARKRGVKSPDRAESVMLAFGNRVLVFGVLDYLKEVAEMKKIGTSQLMKPVMSDKQLCCPACQAVCVSVCSNGWRCGQCGHQWTDKKQALPTGGRKDFLKLVKRA